MARHLGTFAHGILAAYPQPDFLFAAGDDRTDEGLFECLRGGARILHVGPEPTHAAFMVSDFKSLQSLLETFMKARHLNGRKIAGASKIIRTVMRNLVP